MEIFCSLSSTLNIYDILEELKRKTEQDESPYEVNFVTEINAGRISKNASKSKSHGTKSTVSSTNQNIRNRNLQGHSKSQVDHKVANGMSRTLFVIICVVCGVIVIVAVVAFVFMFFKCEYIQRQLIIVQSKCYILAL